MSNTLLRLFITGLMFNILIGFVWDTYYTPSNVWNTDRAENYVQGFDSDGKQIEDSGAMLPKTDNNWQDNNAFGNSMKALGTLFRLLIRGVTITFVPTNAETAIEKFMYMGIKIFTTIFNMILAFYIIAVLWLKNLIVS